MRIERIFVCWLKTCFRRSSIPRRNFPFNWEFSARLCPSGSTTLSSTSLAGGVHGDLSSFSEPGVGSASRVRQCRRGAVASDQTWSDLALEDSEEHRQQSDLHQRIPHALLQRLSTFDVRSAHTLRPSDQRTDEFHRSDSHRWTTTGGKQSAAPLGLLRLSDVRHQRCHCSRSSSTPLVSSGEDRWLSLQWTRSESHRSTTFRQNGHALGLFGSSGPSTVGLAVDFLRHDGDEARRTDGEDSNARTRRIQVSQSVEHLLSGRIQQTEEHAGLRRHRPSIPSERDQLSSVHLSRSSHPQTFPRQTVRTGRGLHSHLHGQPIQDRLSLQVVRWHARLFLLRSSGVFHLQLSFLGARVHQLSPADSLLEQRIEKIDLSRSHLTIERLRRSGATEAPRTHSLPGRRPESVQQCLETLAQGHESGDQSCSSGHSSHFQWKEQSPRTQRVAERCWLRLVQSKKSVCSTTINWRWPSATKQVRCPSFPTTVTTSSNRSLTFALAGNWLSPTPFRSTTKSCRRTFQEHCWTSPCWTEGLSILPFALRRTIFSAPWPKPSICASKVNHSTPPVCVFCIPSNNPIFIKTISEKLALKEAHLTLEFLEECVEGFRNSTVEFITKWLPNRVRFGKQNDDNKRTKVSMILADTAVALASSNALLFSRKVIGRLCRLIEKTCLSPTPTLEQQSIWNDIDILLRYLLMLSFDNSLDVASPLLFLFLFHIVSLLVNTPARSLSEPQPTDCWSTFSTRSAPLPNPNSPTILNTSFVCRWPSSLCRSSTLSSLFPKWNRRASSPFARESSGNNMTPARNSRRSPRCSTNARWRSATPIRRASSSPNEWVWSPWRRSATRCWKWWKRVSMPYPTANGSWPRNGKNWPNDSPFSSILPCSPERSSSTDASRRRLAMARWKLCWEFSSRPWNRSRTSIWSIHWSCLSPLFFLSSPSSRRFTNSSSGSPCPFFSWKRRNSTHPAWLYWNRISALSITCGIYSRTPPARTSNKRWKRSAWKLANLSNGNSNSSTPVWDSRSNRISTSPCSDTWAKVSPQKKTIFAIEKRRRRLVHRKRSRENGTPGTLATGQTEVLGRGDIAQIDAQSETVDRTDVLRENERFLPEEIRRFDDEQRMTRTDRTIASVQTDRQTRAVGTRLRSIGSEKHLHGGNIVLHRADQFDRHAEQKEQRETLHSNREEERIFDWYSQWSDVCVQWTGMWIIDRLGFRHPIRTTRVLSTLLSIGDKSESHDKFQVTSTSAAYLAAFLTVPEEVRTPCPVKNRSTVSAAPPATTNPLPQSHSSTSIADSNSLSVQQGVFTRRWKSWDPSYLKKTRKVGTVFGIGHSRLLSIPSHARHFHSLDIENSHQTRLDTRWTATSETIGHSRHRRQPTDPSGEATCHSRSRRRRKTNSSFSLDDEWNESLLGSRCFDGHFEPSVALDDLGHCFGTRPTRTKCESLTNISLSRASSFLKSFRWSTISWTQRSILFSLSLARSIDLGLRAIDHWSDDRLFSRGRCQWTATATQLPSIVWLRWTLAIRRSVRRLSTAPGQRGVLRQLSRGDGREVSPLVRRTRRWIRTQWRGKQSAGDSRRSTCLVAPSSYLSTSHGNSYARTRITEKPNLISSHRCCFVSSHCVVNWSSSFSRYIRGRCLSSVHLRSKGGETFGLAGDSRGRSRRLLASQPSDGQSTSVRWHRWPTDPQRYFRKDSRNGIGRSGAGSTPCEEVHGELHFPSDVQLCWRSISSLDLHSLSVRWSGFVLGIAPGLFTASIDPIRCRPFRHRHPGPMPLLKDVWREMRTRSMSYAKNFTIVGLVFSTGECHIESVRERDYHRRGESDLCLFLVPSEIRYSQRHRRRFRHRCSSRLPLPSPRRSNTVCSITIQSRSFLLFCCPFAE